jgi:hypothetical protein
MHRAAVQAETERSWGAVLALSEKELSEYDSAIASADDYARHITRHTAFLSAIAAIRAEPDDDRCESTDLETGVQCILPKSCAHIDHKWEPDDPDGNLLDPADEFVEELE